MTGTPRGFNFNAHAANAMGMPYMGNAPPGAGQNFMQMASMMGANGMFNGAMLPGAAGAFPMVPGAAGGPMRQDRRPTNRAPGPYDRNGTAGRNQRWAGNNGVNGNPQAGRLSPPSRGMPMPPMMNMGMNMMPMGAGLTRAQGPPRFGEGGAGPPAATAGRTLRDYQDLDATNEKTEELDY